MARRQKPRRGVVILIVLSMLVLFVLLAVTFAIISGQYRRAAEAIARQEQLSIQPHKDLERGFYQLVRDTRQRGSVARFHSLLRDYYGEDGFTGLVLNNQTVLQDWNTNTANSASGGAAYFVSGGQFLDLMVNNGAGYRSTDGQPFTLSTRPGYYNGCVLSLTSGPARGWSTRIVGFFYQGGRPVLRVLNLQTDDGLTLSWGDIAGESFVVNGRSFNGTGFGFQYVTEAGLSVKNAKTNTTINVVTVPSAPPTASDPSIDAPLALLPNHAARPEMGMPMNAAFAALLRGGVDEGYDAVDYQNMIMAMVTPGAAGSNDILPSFHRPALIRYWMEQLDSDGSHCWNYADFRRLVSMRPVEPNFDGSNPDFPSWDFATWNPGTAAGRDTNPYVIGPWDVDNDGDGVADSIWVDLGLPIQTAPDGRKFKPLFAILCTDMDGRLNVNAHGNPVVFYPNRPNVVNVAPGPSGVGTTTNWPKGAGYGPGEIQLDSITGNLSLLMSSRYGGDNRPGYAGLDPLARIKFFEEPSNYFTGAWPLSSYSTPPDLRGELATGMDVFGQLVSEQVPTLVTEARADSPYEISLVAGNNADQPFTPAELEALQRRFDIDSGQLPDRLTSVVNTGGTASRLMTTDSYDPPVPGVTVIGDLADDFDAAGLHNAKSLMDLYIARGASNATLKQLMPAELLLGQRMDLNRPLGSGKDRRTPADRNGLVDEIGEQADEKIWTDVVAPQFPTVVPYVPVYHTNGADVNNDSTLDIVDHILARQLLARHLYAMAMALKDENFEIDEDGNPANNVAETARAIAQWAINVVDYRDADSTMTYFEYDADPLDGWSPDGDPTTSGDRDGGGVVWGCERPELLISETLAFHDRRSEDLDNDDGDASETTDPDPMKRDNDYDQRILPYGSFFVELFNPWTSGTNQKPRELYNPASPTGVQLARTSTNTSTGEKSPVWRLVFYRDGGQGLDPDDPNAAARPNPTTHERRIIYFVDPATIGTTSPAITGNGIYGTTLNVPALVPGQYAVIGSKGINNAGKYTSPVGRIAGLTSADEIDAGTLQLANTRRIVLEPGIAGNQVRIESNGSTPGLREAFAANDPAYAGQPEGAYSTSINDVFTQPADADILPAAAIVIDTPRSLSVSEPRQGYAGPGGLYPGYTWQDPATTGTLEGFLTSVRDEPFDNNRYGDVLMKDATRGWGTVHLQRLANPNAPYSSQANPYRTIDSLRVDLTAFNGVESPTDPGAGGNVRLASVQRGDRRGNRQFWTQEPYSVGGPGSDTAPNPGGPHYFKHFMRSSLGYLNHGHWPYLGSVSGIYRGAPSVNGTDGITRNDYTFSCLPWSNRPYVSQYELLQVPRHRPSKLLNRYTVSPGGTSPFDPSASSPQYGHLLNFFLSSPTTSRNQSAHIYRILEYLHVPSRFVGTDMVLNPQRFANHEITSGNPNFISNPSSLNPAFLAPFNRISRYRDPGKVNINTILHPQVWNALFGDYQHQSYNAMLASRRGFAGANTSLLPALDARFPTFFANPFRPPGHGTLAPLSRLEREDIETTLLRSNAIPPDAASSGNAPNPSNTPLLQGGVVNANTTATHGRNAFFRYNDLRRLGNMVTTRSNVYSIWITVGYFECEPNLNSAGAVAADAVHPDGYRVAQEMGLDTGEVRRHRAFYMIDRTIPVAFQPGQNHNVDRCVLLRRMIE